MSAADTNGNTRRLSYREIILIAGMLANFGSLVWIMATNVARWEQWGAKLAMLEQTTARLVDAVAQNKLIEYRVTEAERVLRALTGRR